MSSDAGVKVNLNVDLAGPAGRLEAILDEPAGRPRAAAVFAHPHPLHGGTMHTKVVFRGAKALAAIGCATLRFNFRGIGLSAGAYDEGRGEQDDLTAAIDFIASRYPGLPIWAAGFSFGAYIALLTGAKDPRIQLLLGVAPPVTREDLLETLRVCEKPKFFVHGERDEWFSLKSVQSFYAQLPEPKELVVVDGADHLFDGKTTEVAEAIEDLLGDWTS